MTWAGGVGAGGREAVAAGAKYPAFREELVGTLLAALQALPASRLSSLPPSDATLDDTASQQDIAGVLRAGASMHARSSLCDWTSAAKIALQACMACTALCPAPTRPLLQSLLQVTHWWHLLLLPGLHC